MTFVGSDITTEGIWISVTVLDRNRSIVQTIYCSHSTSFARALLRRLFAPVQHAQRDAAIAIDLLQSTPPVQTVIPTICEQETPCTLNVSISLNAHGESEIITT